MKWLLIYEFDVEIYRRAPTIRIFLENHLLNEFTLDKRKFEIIEFDYEPMDENNLTIQFKNNDNNFTNGFMTKSTYIIPLQCWLVPKYFVENYDKIVEHYEIKFTKKNYYMYRRTGRHTERDPSKYRPGLEYIKYYYRKRHTYPKNLFTKFSNTYDFDPNIHKHIKENPLEESVKYGTSDLYHYKLHKKHGTMFYSHGLKQKGFVWLTHGGKYSFNNVLKHLKNIYK